MLLSIVIPVLNEAQVVPLLLERLRDTLREVSGKSCLWTMAARTQRPAYWRARR